MTYPIGHGTKKPLNVIEGPMYPDIKKGPPRFVDAGKHWQVDTGAVQRDAENFAQLLNDAVLAQSRSYNQDVYGVSSHRDVVNKAFRPPLLTPDDYEPLTRQRRKITVPRVNPGTADTATRGYTTQNERPSSIGAHLTDRVKHGDWRPTFFCPLDLPKDNSVLPDLETTLPAYSTDAGLNTVVQIDAPPAPVVLAREGFTPVLDAGTVFPTTLDGEVARPADLPETVPGKALHTGLNTPVRFDGETRLGQLRLAENRPRYAASAGAAPGTRLSAPDPRETQLTFAAQPRAELYTNPGTAAYDGHDYAAAQRALTSKVGNTVPQVAYRVPAAATGAAENYRTGKLVMRETIRAQLDTTGYQAGGFVPRAGLDIPRVQLRPNRPLHAQQRHMQQRRAQPPAPRYVPEFNTALPQPV